MKMDERRWFYVNGYIAFAVVILLFIGQLIDNLSWWQSLIMIAGAVTAGMYLGGYITEKISK